MAAPSLSREKCSVSLGARIRRPVPRSGLNGLGKTSITLAALKLLIKEQTARRALIVAPLRVCYAVWPVEAKRWQEFNGLKIELLHGPDKLEALNREADIYVVNFDGIAWLDKVDGFRKLGCDVLVVDELSKFKHPGTQRYKIMRKHLPSFRRRWGLTGTPASNGYLDLFGQCYVLDQGLALGRFITHYRQEFFYQSGYGGYTWLMKEGSEEKIQQRIKPLVLRLEAEDYVKMPAQLDNIVRVELPEKVRKVYDDLEEELVAELESGAVVTAVSAGSAMMKCCQVANGGVYRVVLDEELVGTPKRVSEALHSAKTEALVDLVEELQGSPLLVAYEFEHDVDRIKAALGDVPVLGGGTTARQADDIIARWNRDAIPVLLAHPASAGHGLNLQEGAGRTICWYGLTWDFELYDQFIRRIRRSGSQHDNIVVHHIIASNTIDEAKLRSLRAKRKDQKGLLDALKAYVRTRLT